MKIEPAHLLRPQPAATPVTVCWGDGIGPEIMDATLRILEAGGARIAAEPIVAGEAMYRMGHSAGIDETAWDSIRRTRVLLKAPITTPAGGGVKSLNVTLRKRLGLYANVRPCVAYAPYVRSPHPGMDVAIVRENEEDLYAGIEHRQTAQVVQCLKLVSRPGCERIVRHAFEYARAHGRRKVTCMLKDNIMKMTDGLFREVFEAVGAEYPDIAREHCIVDIGAARLATRPERFDVVVAPNLYGDILSDIAAEVAGSVGLAGSANIGEHAAMFEAVHGSAPDIAGRDIANPSGLLNAALMMLVHIGQHEAAARIQQAWLRTLEDGIHTADIAGDATVRQVGTRAFAEAVAARMGQSARVLRAALPKPLPAQPRPAAAQQAQARPARKALAGADVFVAFEGTPEALAARLQAAAAGLPLVLRMVTNRGVKVWPGGFPETFCTDHWRCRFMPHAGVQPGPRDVWSLSALLSEAGIDVIKLELLHTFDGVPGFSLGQGQ